jgi:hypothetical protein
MPLSSLAGRSDRAPLNDRYALAVTTNPKYQGKDRMPVPVRLANRGLPPRQEEFEPEFRLALSQQYR